MKKALIIGTSNSEATCQREKGGLIEYIQEQRWHDYLKTDHGYEVVNLSKSNCSVQQQFFTATNYKADNPDQRFNIAIVEGRQMETTVSAPIMRTKLPLPGFMDENASWEENRRWQYYSWRDVTNKEKNKIYSPFDVMSSRSEERIPEYMPYYADYAHSWQHCVDTWSTNYALCNFLETFCDKVVWYTHGASMDLNSFDHPFQQYGWPLMKRFTLTQEMFMGVREREDHDFTDDDFCACKHFNEQGNRKLWYNKLYPLYKDFI